MSNHSHTIHLLNPTGSPLAGATPATPAVDHCVARYESCSIARGVSGEYLVRHGAFPGQRWVTANLPTAHALCTELITRQGAR